MNNGQLQINELTAILNEHFHWNKARMGCFVGMLIALIVVGTVNLTQCWLYFFLVQHWFHHDTDAYNGFLVNIGLITMKWLVLS